MALIGIIANPASGKDIRRLVAYGSIFDNQEKVRIVRRVLLGIDALGVEEIAYMPEYYGIVERALLQVTPRAVVRPIAMKARNNQDDSTLAAHILQESGAACIITLGGDGTNRVVAKGSLNVPLLPLSTGTNNVFPLMIEGTLAGIAAGLVARNLVPLPESTYRSSKLEILVDEEVKDIALVDIAVYQDLFVGSRAVWETEKISQMFINRANPASIGLSAIGALLHPFRPEDPVCLHLILGPGGTPVLAPVAPGVITRVHVEQQELLSDGEAREVLNIPAVLALDGEREFETGSDVRPVVRLCREGPLVIDVNRVMSLAVENRIFVGERIPSRRIEAPSRGV